MALNLKQLLDNCRNEKGPLADLVKALAEKVIEMERSKKQSAKDIIKSFREP
jgi:hypothetical protein